MPRQFLYFLEGREAIGPAEATQLGLGHVVDAGVTRRKVNGAGPGGQHGIVVARGEDGVGYFPDRQEWFPFGRPGVWCGWIKGQQPGPEDLAREKQLPGHAIRLADGNVWTIPAARRWQGDHFRRVLPARAALSPAGTWTSGAVLPQFAELWDASERWMAHLEAAAEEGEKRLPVSEALDMCCTALAVNYRVSRGEAAALGLLDDQQQAMLELLDAVIDRPTFRRWLEQQKKTDEPQTASSSSTSPGGGD